MSASGVSIASDDGFLFRAPRSADGPVVSDLIRACPPLDENSAYCNLLQCTHFDGTCILAERGGAVVGWVSGYRPADRPGEIFVWQVAVHPDARGAGLGARMLWALLARPAVADATTLTTTITEANKASWAMFGALARRVQAPLASRPFFERDTHFAGVHDTEHLVSIGPIPVRPVPTLKEAS